MTPNTSIDCNHEAARIYHFGRRCGAAKTNAGPGIETTEGFARVYKYRCRSGTRRHHVPAGCSISIDPRRVRRGDLVGRYMASDSNLHGSVLVAHVRDRGWVSSVLLAPTLLDNPAISIHPVFPLPHQCPTNH